MKVIAKTTGNFMVIDSSEVKNIVYEDRPSVVDLTPFLHHRSAVNQIQIIAKEVPEQATDENFLEFWNDSKGDEELAVQSFLAQFEVKEVKPTKDKK